MFAASDLSKLSKPELYRELTAQISALIEGETDPVANMANCAALIFHSLPRVNWAGFYLLKGGELVLGPFQGQPACVRIAFGRGVVGTAAEKRSTIRVADVNQFPGHIACDTASKEAARQEIRGRRSAASLPTPPFHRPPRETDRCRTAS